MGAWSSVKALLVANRAWLLPLAGSGAALAVALPVMAAIWSENPNDESVVADWNETIGRLGIEPVFPPEEDIYVGDILAVIAHDNRPKGDSTRAEPLLNRAIKLDHIDMLPLLLKYYDSVPIFPDTERRPSSADDVWPQHPNPDGSFAKHPARGVLSLAAFPGFVIRHARAASGLLSWAGLGFGGSRHRDDTVELRIPFAETYGVPSLLATGVLQDYCEDRFNRDVCTDHILRRHLSYVNRHIFERFTEADGKQRRSFDVEVVLVNRVYLTRSIEQTRSIDEGTDASLAARHESVSPPGTPLPPPAPDTAASGTAPADPGGAASERVAASNSSALKQTFQRPVVIGYRSVRYKIPEAEDVTDTASPGAGGEAKRP